MRAREKLGSQFIRDAIHKNININEPVVKDLIACKEFQRLRWISQLGGAQIAFPSATHTRFTHSLGVYHVLNRVFNEVSGADAIDAKEQLVVKIAGLLHDIGHGPFSHAFEKVLNLKDELDYQYNHEFYTCAIISDERTEINQVLKKYQIDVDRIVSIIKKDQNRCSKYQIQLVSSQLDCDRIDYLIRDGYFTGVNYGSIDLDWVISNMIIDQDKGIFFNAKALPAIENYLVTRFHMYRQVYLHKTSIFFDLKLQNLFGRLVQLEKENHQWTFDVKKIQPILKQETIDVTEYLELNDATIINLAKDIVCYESDEILLNWAKAFLYNQEQDQIILDTKEPKSNEVKFKFLKNTIYDLKKDPIMIQDANQEILRLEEISQLLKNPTEEQKLFYWLEKKT